MVSHQQKNGKPRQLLDAAGNPLRRFSYDAVNNQKRRRPSTGTLQSEDRQLPSNQRRQLLSETRDLQRNFSLAAWAIRKHLDFVSTFTFQAKTSDEALNALLEKLMGWWSDAAACDAAGRHSLSGIIRLMESRAVVDGDVGIIKLRSGRLQGIEGDRIKTPWGMGVEGASVPVENLTHGVRIGKAGRALAYCVCRRGSHGSGFHFERMVSARNMLLHGYFDRFDQVRGISPLAAAYNTYQDVYEATTYALLKAKVSQMFGLVVTRNPGDEDSLGQVTQSTDAAGTEAPGYDIDFGKGPFFADLSPGDDMKFLDNKTPSAEFREFITTTISLALKGLDIPFNFYDESHTNFFGSKAAVALYLKSCRRKRNNLLAAVRDLTRWRMSLWVLDGVLTLPGNMTVRDVKFEWIPDGLPWWDKSKEVAGDVAAINAGLQTRTEIRKERYGDDWKDVVDKLAEERAYMEKQGLISNEDQNG